MPKIVFGEPDPDADDAVDPSFKSTGIIDITIDYFIPEESFRSKICLRLESIESLGDLSRLCLAFFKPDRQRWFCEYEDVFVEYGPDGIAYGCGFTTHYTNFAVLLVGTGSSGYRYFTGDWRGDVSIAAGIAIFILIIGSIIIAVATVKKMRDNRELKKSLSTGTPSRRSRRTNSMSSSGFGSMGSTSSMVSP